MPDASPRPPTTLRERAGQCVMVRAGSNLPPPTPVSDDVDRVEALLERCPVGGLLLFRGRWPAVTDALDRLQAASRFPLLVASDVERGVGQQVEGGTLFPHARALGAGPAPADAAARLARITACEARRSGIHWSLAPVADVNTAAANPIVGTRAFGDRVERVVPAVRAYVEAAREAGLLTAAKHFPGHGRTQDDSHDTLPVVRAARQALEAVDLPPFRAAVEAGTDAVMTAHVAVPALDDREHPATASRPILNDLLRGEMGFEGVVVTDSLLMEGARAKERSPGEQAAALLEAGVDVLLDPEDPEAVVDGLVEAVQAGALDEARLDEACGRVWSLKERVHDRWGQTAFAPGRAEEGAMGEEAHRRAARALAREGITVLDATPDAWPMPPHEHGGELLVVAVTPQGHALKAFRGALEERYAHVRFVRLDGDADEGAFADARRAAADARRVVAACVVEPAAWTVFALPEAHQALVCDLAGPRTALLAMGSPHVLDALPPSGARACTYSSVPASQEAAAAALAGAPRSP